MMTTAPDIDALAERFGLTDEARTQLVALAGLGPAEPVILPRGDELVETALRLTVPHLDVSDLLAVRDQLEQDATLWWLLEQGNRLLVQTMGTLPTRDTPSIPTPPLPASLGAVGRYFYAFMFMSALPAVRAYHRGRGIPDEISWRTLTDLGRHMTTYRWKYGTGGLHAPFWHVLHYTGRIYQLGRLQFDRSRLGTTSGEAIAAAGLPYRTGEPVIGVHIPAWSGPFDPAACDESFRQAKAFYREYYPNEPHRLAVCHSWLLDPALAEYLPASSNIVQFQRRFQLVYQPETDGGSTFQFVFGRSDLPLDDYPAETSLQRAVVAHVREGKTWRGGFGWLPFD